MDTNTVAKALVEVHKEIETDTGHDTSSISMTCHPLNDLRGFDSPLIPNAVRMVAKKVGTKLPKDAKIHNIYVSENGERKLTVEEAAQRFCDLYVQEA